MVCNAVFKFLNISEISAFEKNVLVIESKENLSALNLMKYGYLRRSCLPKDLIFWICWAAVDENESVSNKQLPMPTTPMT